MTNKPFFITGMLRSGTTLLQNILDSIPQLGCSNQQMTELFIHSKRAFLRHKNQHTYHLLSNYFPSITDPSEFTDYLGHINFQHQYLQNLKPTKAGNKEVLAEEFIPFLARQFKTILIIRNPKDVITSLRFGNYATYTGPHRPLLFDIRNWRKSVAFAIKEETNPNFLLVKYENLVSNFVAELNKILHFLFSHKVEKPLQFMINLPNNSSFHDSRKLIHSESINNFLNFIPPNIQNTIDYLCFSEMKYLDYSVQSRLDIDLKKIEEFKNYNYSEREEFKNFDLNMEIEREEYRLSYLKPGIEIAKEGIRENFIFEEVYQTLKEVV